MQRGARLSQGIDLAAEWGGFVSLPSWSLSARASPAADRGRGGTQSVPAQSSEPRAGDTPQHLQPSRATVARHHNVFPRK